MVKEEGLGAPPFFLYPLVPLSALASGPGRAVSAPGSIHVRAVALDEKEGSLLSLRNQKKSPPSQKCPANFPVDPMVCTTLSQS